jgi:hypothetical protein
MPKRRLIWIVVLAVLLSLSFTRPAYGYIDPGTTGSIFAMLAPFIAIFLAFLGFLIRPIRVFFISMFAKLRGNPGSESPASGEQPESVDSTGDEEGRESTGE